jgi:transcriptional regulator with XRE-family HTH domain
MSGHRPFGELTKTFTPERRARVAARAAALREEMTLEELRKSRSLSQEDLASAMAVGQPAISKPSAARSRSPHVFRTQASSSVMSERSLKVDETLWASSSTRTQRLPSLPYGPTDPRNPVTRARAARQRSASAVMSASSSGATSSKTTASTPFSRWKTSPVRR